MPLLPPPLAMPPPLSVEESPLGPEKKRRTDDRQYNYHSQENIPKRNEQTVSLIRLPVPLVGVVPLTRFQLYPAVSLSSCLSIEHKALSFRREGFSAAQLSTFVPLPLASLLPFPLASLLPLAIPPTSLLPLSFPLAFSLASLLPLPFPLASLLPLPTSESKEQRMSAEKGQIPAEIEKSFTGESQPKG